MKKTNKIMMISVSVLLSLVLITSSVVSTTFAKYATSVQASTGARVAKWGAVIEVDLEEMPAELIPQNYKNMSVITFSTADAPLKMQPGTDYSNALKIKISGKSEVALRVAIVIEVENTFEAIPQGKVANLNADKYFMPLGFTFAANNVVKTGNAETCTKVIENTYIANPWVSADSKNALSNAVEAEMLNSIEKEMAVDIEDSAIEMRFQPNTDIYFGTVNDKTVNEIVFGFKWDDKYTDNSGLNYDAVGQYILDNMANSTFGVNYTIIIEQVN